MRCRLMVLLMCTVYAVGNLSVVHAQQTATEVDYARDIAPLLAAWCLGCHGPDEQEAGLRLDRRAAALAKAESGQPAIVPGDPQQSELVRRIRTRDDAIRMPPEGQPLTLAEQKRLATWIRAGAPFTKHWAYRPLSGATPPSTQLATHHPIDRFIVARLEAAGLQPSPRADRYQLIKRLYYDLLGLPPTVEAVDAFVHDVSPAAYERLVDQLLASPRFGERWGRHWLDKARYADSDGYEKDNARPQAYRYRDWVIQAINADQPFDTFTVEQLAGDLLAEATSEQHLATAFHRQTLTNTEGGTDREQWRVAAVMDRTETLGTVWLGLTVGCARCHNHKYDQFSQDEYYELFAFFNNADEVTYELPAASGKPTKVRTVAQRQTPRTTHVLRRGDFLQPLHQVSPGTPLTLPELVEDHPHPQPGRLALARWLVGGKNPLTPRVVVNQYWQHLFGEGLVRTPDDFGVRGKQPTHPELLDWLAAEWVRRKWSPKALLRLIVLSSTYQQSSAHGGEADGADPQNLLLHRQNRFRVEAEIVRDVALHSSGSLSTRLGGPSVFPPIPKSVTELTYNSGFRWTTSAGEDRYRRGLYTFFKRTAPHPNLTTFDCPSSNVTNVRRSRSNTPIGALVTLNNEVFVEAARHWAIRLERQSGTREARLAYLWRSCLARPPRAEEVQQLKALHTQARDFYAEHREAANELIQQTPQENLVDAAAWMVTARVVLNLDEFLNRE